MLKKQLAEQLKINVQYRLHTDAVAADNRLLMDYLDSSEHVRRRTMQDLQTSLSKNDAFKNEIAYIGQNVKFAKV